MRKIFLFPGFFGLFFFVGCAQAPVKDSSSVPSESESTTVTNTSAVNAPSTNVVFDDVTDAEKILSGSFQNGVHPTTGMARIITENGKGRLVFSDDFSTDAGPDLHVFLSGSKNPVTSQELHAAGDLKLGALQSTRGAQEYVLPSDIAFDIGSVVIYCVPFKVVFGFAPVQ